MIKRLQNKVAESTFLLPAMAAYTMVVWLVSGLVQNQWWEQLACMVASVYLMVELSNANALLRVRSRMVSSVFLVLSATACFLFGSLSGGIVQLCFIGTLIILFRTYQDPQAPGWVFYSFLCMGLASLVFVHSLYFVPLFWLLMATQLQSFSMRTWVASVIGLTTPYWFLLPWVLYRQEPLLLTDHFAPLVQFPFPYDYATLSVSRLVVFVFTNVLTLIAIFHFWYRSYEDKIRIRQLYGIFTVMVLLSIVWLALQPQHYDALMRIIIVCASPLVAHFFTLTNSRFSNGLFCAATALAALLTVLSLLEPHWQTIVDTLTALWTGLLNF